MPTVEFETDKPLYKSRTILGQPQRPGMVSWMVRKGIIKDESKAGGILIGIVICNIVLTSLVIYLYVL